MAQARRPFPAVRAGAVLQDWRGHQSLEQVCRWLKANAKVPIGPSTLFRYEKGRYPPPPVLWGLGALYKRSLTTLVRLYVVEGVRVAPPVDEVVSAPPDSLTGQAHQVLDVVLRGIPEEQRLTAALKGAEAMAVFAHDLKKTMRVLP